MNIKEKPLSTEELNEINRFSDDGLQTLGLSEVDGANTIVTAINNHIVNQRVNIAQTSEDDYAQLILSMAYLWGNQVCRMYQWEWVGLIYGGGKNQALVSPNRAFAVNPLFFVKGLIDDPDQNPTVVLLFNMLEANFLKQQFPNAQAGTYVSLS